MRGNSLSYVLISAVRGDEEETSFNYGHKSAVSKNIS